MSSDTQFTRLSIGTVDFSPVILSQRLDFIDIAKGIGILLVVYGHALRGLASALLVRQDSALFIVDYVIYAVHMPLFFVLSGLFFETSLTKAPTRFWRGRVKTIAYPYLLWSLLQGSIQVMMSGSGATNTALGWDRLVTILWAPISPFWFLYALLVANILAALVRNAPQVIVIGTAFLAFFASLALPAYPVLNDIAYGFVYFFVGIMLGRRGIAAVGQHARIVWLPAFAVFLALALGLYALDVPERLPIPAALAGLVALTGASVMLAERAPSILRDALLILGSCSMGIYLLHILVIGLSRTLALRFFGIDDLVLLLPLCTAAGVLVPLFIVITAQRLGVATLLGIAPSGFPRRAPTNSPGSMPVSERT